MKRFSISLFIVIMAVITAHSQKTNPEEKSIVNKQFDENGNLIQYDSTFVWSWNSDSTFNFEFPENSFFGGNFPGFDGMSIDSIMSSHFNKQFFHFNPFESDAFFKQFGEQFPDSLNEFPFGINGQTHGQFMQRDLEEMQKEFQRQYGDIQQNRPQFETEAQQKEWEALMKKQQKEQEEFMEKWNKKK